MAAKRTSRVAKISDPAVELLDRSPVDLAEFEVSPDVDLAVDSVLRAQLAHESPGEWVTPYPAMSAALARDVAKKWRTSKPSTFGATERFEAEVVRLIPRQWWRVTDLVEQWTVRVRYPNSTSSEQRNAS